MKPYFLLIPVLFFTKALSAQLYFADEAGEEIETILLDATDESEIVSAVFSINNPDSVARSFIMQRELRCNGNPSVEELLCFSIACITVYNSDSIWQSFLLPGPALTNQYVRSSYFNLEAPEDYLSVYKYRMIDPNDSNNVMDSLNILVFTGNGSCGGISGNEEVRASVDFRITPNPAVDFINISFEKSVGKALIRIHDLSGQILKEAEVVDGNCYLNLNTLSKGTYIITVQNAQYYGVGKFMKI